MINHEQFNRGIDQLLADQENFSSTDLAEALGITRQAVHRHLRRRVALGELDVAGKSRSTRYSRSNPVAEGKLAQAPPSQRSHALTGLSEDLVWDQHERECPGLQEPSSKKARSILHYTLTELVNNAIDHSKGSEVKTALWSAEHASHPTFYGSIVDDGIGAFESVRLGLGLDDALHALQELCKGKVTTMADRHSGEGLFFCSKSVDRFELSANGLRWIIDNELDDQTVQEAAHSTGTSIHFRIQQHTTRVLSDVFDRYTTNFEFDKSHYVVQLLTYGIDFISRSQAKRIVQNLERFREVVIDFKGVESVGQGFVDETFRVWGLRHPAVKLTPINMNTAVEFMVRRGLPVRDE